MTDSNNGTKITLYWLEKSRSQRILWLLEELNLSYDLQTFKRQPDLLAPPELKKIHPLGKSPVISVQPPGSTDPIVIAESAFIVEYLCEHFGAGNGKNLIPARYTPGKEGQIGGETEEWMRYRYFMHYSEGSLMPFLVMQLVMDQVKQAPIPFFLRFIPRIVAEQVEKQFLTRNIYTNFDFLEDQLKTAPDGGPWFCGKEMTAVDIMMSFPLTAAAARVPDVKKYPLIAAYVERVQKVEGYKRAVRKVEEVEGEEFKVI